MDDDDDDTSLRLRFCDIFWGIFRPLKKLYLIQNKELLVLYEPSNKNIKVFTLIFYGKPCFISHQEFNNRN
jgi:hypothetical protein